MKHITIKERRFSKREGCWGIAYPDQNLIKIDPRLPRNKYVEILIHELMHIVQPYLEEDTVKDSSEVIAAYLLEKMEEKGWLASTLKKELNLEDV